MLIRKDTRHRHVKIHPDIKTHQKTSWYKKTRLEALRHFPTLQDTSHATCPHLASHALPQQVRCAQRVHIHLGVAVPHVADDAAVLHALHVVARHHALVASRRYHDVHLPYHLQTRVQSGNLTVLLDAVV